MHGKAIFSGLVPWLAELGLLLQQDKFLPNVVTFITGESLSSSWWKHPQAHTVFRCLSELADHPDVLQTKLVAGKVTFVHRRLWPAVLAAATARAPWQLVGLSPAARKLLEQVESKGKTLAAGPPAQEIERRLLAHGEQVHTESGAHKTCVETWLSWSQRARCTTDLSPADGQAQLEEAVGAVGGEAELLPWRNRRGRRS